MDIPKRVRHSGRVEEIVEDGRRVLRVEYIDSNGKTHVGKCIPGEKNLSELAVNVIRNHYLKGLDM